MSDTGAPWNLPFPLSTDLVRDGADAIKALAEATATGLSAAGNAGIGSNVVQTVKTDTFTTSSTAYVGTGLSASITPTSATSKILVIIHASVGNASPAYLRISGGNAGTYVGDADGSRVRAASQSTAFDTEQNATTIVYLDSPNTASSTTYELEMRRGSITSANIHLNRSDSDTNDGNRARTASSITLIEVEA
jgi:hypothetical protein